MGCLSCQRKMANTKQSCFYLEIIFFSIWFSCMGKHWVGTIFLFALLSVRRCLSLLFAWRIRDITVKFFEQKRLLLNGILITCWANEANCTQSLIGAHRFASEPHGEGPLKRRQHASMVWNHHQCPSSSWLHRLKQVMASILGLNCSTLSRRLLKLPIRTLFMQIKPLIQELARVHYGVKQSSSVGQKSPLLSLKEMLE